MIQLTPKQLKALDRLTNDWMRMRPNTRNPWRYGDRLVVLGYAEKRFVQSRWWYRRKQL